MIPRILLLKKLVWEQGALIEKTLAEKGRRIFTIESVYDNQEPEKEIISLNAGHPTEVHVETLRSINNQLIVEVQGQSDILIAGVSNRECYSKFSTMNPILAMNQAMGNTVMQFQENSVVRQNGIVIIANPMSEKFDERYFAPYIEFYQRLLPESLDPYQLWENYVEEFANRPEYIQSYRYGHAYHGSHPFFMWNSTGIPRKYLSDIYFAGVKDFEAANRCGVTPFATVEEAIQAAESNLGHSASISLLQRPPHLDPKNFYHLEPFSSDLISWISFSSLVSSLYCSRTRWKHL